MDIESIMLSVSSRGEENGWICHIVIVIIWKGIVYTGCAADTPTRITIWMDTMPKHSKLIYKTLWDHWVLLLPNNNILIKKKK